MILLFKLSLWCMLAYIHFGVKRRFNREERDSYLIGFGVGIMVCALIVC